MSDRAPNRKKLAVPTDDQQPPTGSGNTQRTLQLCQSDELDSLESSHDKFSLPESGIELNSVIGKNQVDSRHLQIQQDDQLQAMGNSFSFVQQVAQQPKQAQSQEEAIPIHQQVTGHFAGATSQTLLAQQQLNETEQAATDAPNQQQAGNAINLSNQVISPPRPPQSLKSTSSQRRGFMAAQNSLLSMDEQDFKTPTDLDSERMGINALILPNTDSDGSGSVSPTNTIKGLPKTKEATVQLAELVPSSGFSFNRGQNSVAQTHNLQPVNEADEVSKPTTTSNSISSSDQLSTPTNVFTSNQGKSTVDLLRFQKPSSNQFKHAVTMSSDESYQARQLYDEAIAMEIEDQKQSRNQEKSIQFLTEKILKPGENSAVRQLLNQHTLQDENYFASCLNTGVCFIHIYNFFTCCLFMGIEGYPEGIWFVFEILFEVILVFELIMQFILRNYLTELWNEMHILHGIGQGFTKTKLLRYLLVAFPQTIILSLFLHKSPEVLLSFGVAVLRILKLLRFNEVKDTFDRSELKQRQKSAFSVTRILFILFYFQAFLHFWACVWLMTGRLDWSASDTAGWYNMAKFHMNPTMFEKYYESYYFIVTTFSGAGFGNIIPSTNCEWFVDTCLNLIGSSLFVCIFVDFTMEFSMRNLTQFENDNLLDETLQFAESSRLPEGLVFKIRYYYKDLHLKFEDFLIKKQIINEMPPSIKGKVAIMLNREIIESVKFFQLADQKFIEDVSCLLCPQVCLNDDYICHKDDGADKMYFVHSGYIEILQQNGVTPLIFFGKGAYFGEIGVLLTGKRSLSVRAKSNAVIYYIPKEDFCELLENYPKQKEFLREVAQQRLSSPAGTVQDFSPTQSEFSTPNQSQSGGRKEPSAVKEVNTLFERKTTTLMHSKPWFSQKIDSLRLHIMIPFSPIWWLWNIALIVAITLNSILIPYGISFEASFVYHPIIISCIIVYTIDIPMRIRTGVTSDHKISIKPVNNLRTYFDKWLILDVVATFPFEWILVPTGNEMTARYVLLLRLLKVGRLIETCEIIRKNSRHSYSTAVFFMELFFMFGFLIHWLACIFGWVGRRELVRNPKYDGNTFFKDFTSRPYITLGPLNDLPMWDQYTVCLYVAGSIVQAATYGDCIPSTAPEQTIVIVFLCISNTLRAFLFVRMAKFLGNMQKQQTLKIKKSRKIEGWMKSNKLSKTFMERIKKFTHDIRHEKSMFEGSEIIEHLPLSLQTEIRKYLQISQSREYARRQSKSSFGGRIQMLRTSQLSVTVTAEDFSCDLAERPDLTKQYKQYVKMKKIKEWVILLIITYNIGFIPLQFSYKLEFSPVFIVMEVTTIVVYLLDIAFKFHTISWLCNLDCIDHSVLKRKHRKIKQSTHHRLKEIERQKFQIVVTLIAVVPLSLIIRSSETLSQLNMYAIVGLCSLRLIKLQPLVKFFQQKQKDALTQWRIMQTVFYYYCICHWFANIMIYMAIYDEDWTANWLRRCPVPQVAGTRTEPAYRDDMSMLSVYVHALYYVVSTVSHVAIADITAVRQNEFVANTIFGWCGFFIYCLLYADITLLVSNANSGNYRNFIKRRNDVISKLKSPNIPQYIVSQATLFLDYTYEIHEGVEQEDVLKELPYALKLDFLMEKYKNIVEQCMLFRGPMTAEVNMALAQEVLKALKTQIFLNETFILKVGQVTTDAILLLEGNLNVLTIVETDLLGTFVPGDYYATDLDDKINNEYNKQFFMKTQKDAPPKLTLNPLDNLENRSMVHLIARKFVTVGYISRENLEALYRKFPMLKTTMRQTNRYMFDVGRKAIEHVLVEEKRPITREECLNMLEGDYEKSSDSRYKEIIRTQRPTVSIIKLDDQLEINISQSTKQFYIDQLDPEARKKFTKLFLQEEKVVEKEPFIMCCEEFMIFEQSTTKRFLTYLMFCNRIYVALAVPFYIAFNVLYTGNVLVAEVISHFISFCGFVLTFRTPVVNESGELTLDFQKVYKNYVKNGMFFDIIAFQPFNLILPLVFNFSDDRSFGEWIVLVSLTPLRLFRLVSVWGALRLYDQIKIDYRKSAQTLNSVGNIFFIFLIGHWAVCIWVFLTSIIEDHYQTNWQSYQKLEEGKQLWEVYIRNWYAIANIVSSVGSGDVFGTTDLERLFFIVLMTAADIVFALAFGLLAELTSNARANNPQQNFFNKMLSSQRIMQQSQFNDNWRDRVQQYRTYKHELQTSHKNLNAEDMRKELPECLIKEILYHSNRTFLIELFKGIESENLMRDLAFATSTQIFMPDDVVIRRKKTVQKIFFIVEGTATKFNKRGRAIEQLQEGQFCGEFALLKDIRPSFTVRAQTFMLVKVLKKSDIDSILDHYPQFKKDLVAPPSPQKQQAKRKQTLATALDAFNASMESGTLPQIIQESEQYSEQMRGTITSFQRVNASPQVQIVDEDSDSGSSSSSADSSVLSGTVRQREDDGFEALPSQPPQHSWNRGRRQTLDARNFMRARQFMHAQGSLDQDSQVRRSRESLADQVIEHYKQAKTLQKQAQRQQSNKQLIRPQRRLSQVSIGSKLTIKQSLGGLKIALESDN